MKLIGNILTSDYNSTLKGSEFEMQQHNYPNYNNESTNCLNVTEAKGLNVTQVTAGNCLGFPLLLKEVMPR